MIINSVSNTYPTSRALSMGSANQASTSGNVSPSGASVSSNSNGTMVSGSLDFTNMSPREFNDLFKSGGFGDELPPIVLPKNGMDAHNQNPNEILDQKFNYIDNARRIIAFNKSIGTSTELQDRELNKMLALQGKNIQKHPTINSMA